MVAYRRHLLTKHSLRLVTRRRYDRTVEEFVPIPADEVKRRRMLLSNRQGGRSEIRRQLRQAMSMPPSLSTEPSTQPEFSSEPRKTFAVTSNAHVDNLVSSSPASTACDATSHHRGSRSCSGSGASTAAHDVVMSTTSDDEHTTSPFCQNIDVVAETGIPQNSVMPSETFAVTSDVRVDNLVSNTPATTPCQVTKVIVSSDSCFYSPNNSRNIYV